MLFRSVIGSRNVLRALLIALLEPVDQLRAAEQRGDLTTRLALQEQSKSMPWGAVWEHYCESKGAPGDRDWLKAVHTHELKVLASRGARGV